jgi:hypothetical protein
MTTIPHEPVASAGKRRWTEFAGMTQMWATLAIVAIWLSVLVSALFAPDIVTQSATATTSDHATIPSGVVVALFAAIATWPVAWFGFKRERRS